MFTNYPEKSGARSSKEIRMSLIDDSGDDTVIEECVEELDELVMSLDRHPPAAVAVAIGMYLKGLLGALLDERQSTASDVRELQRDRVGCPRGAGTGRKRGLPRTPLGGVHADLRLFVGRYVGQIWECEIKLLILLILWRRERDSNPRRAFDPYTLSRGAPSTTRPSLRPGEKCLRPRCLGVPGRPSREAGPP
jgi:hypothetical protein